MADQKQLAKAANAIYRAQNQQFSNFLRAVDRRYKTFHRVEKISRWVSLISAFIAVVSIILYVLLPLLPSSFSWLSMHPEFIKWNTVFFWGSILFSLAGGAISYSKRNAGTDSFARFTPPEGQEYSTIIQAGLTTQNGGVYKFEDLKPSSKTARIILPGLGCNECAEVEDQLDNWLMTEPDIRFSTSNKLNHPVYPKEISGDQLRFLYAKVHGNTVTSDDKKFRISNDFGYPPEAIVALEPSTYYDALVTNEAFRSKLYLANPGGFIPDDSDPIADLTLGFPAEKDGAAFRLMKMEHSLFGNHVGASVLTISSDNHPVFFRQNKSQEISGGKIVVSGTGSVDFADIVNAQPAGNFLNIIRFSMFREFFEEGLESKVTNRDKKQSPMPLSKSRLSKDVMIIGFFRWISRMGKPEFMGVYRSGRTFAQINADNIEVSAVATQQDFSVINCVADFRRLRDEIESTQTAAGARKYSMALSSAMVVHRLADLATNGNDAQKQTLAKMLSFAR